MAALRASAASTVPIGHVVVTTKGMPNKESASSLAAAHLHGLGQPHTLHTLRHRFGTRLYALSRDIRLTQELMGHQNPATTALYVKHSSVDAQRKVDELSLELNAR